MNCKFIAKAEHIETLAKLYLLQGEDRSRQDFLLHLDEAITKAQLYSSGSEQADFYELAIDNWPYVKQGVFWYRSAVIVLCAYGDDAQLKKATEYVLNKSRVFLADILVALERNSRSTPQTKKYYQKIVRQALNQEDEA